jgi:hypothetical protein
MKASIVTMTIRADHKFECAALDALIAQEKAIVDQIKACDMEADIALREPLLKKFKNFQKASKNLVQGLDHDFLKASHKKNLRTSDYVKLFNSKYTKSDWYEYTLMTSEIKKIIFESSHHIDTDAIGINESHLEGIEETIKTFIEAYHDLDKAIPTEVRQILLAPLDSKRVEASLDGKKLQENFIKHFINNRFVIPIIFIKERFSVVDKDTRVQISFEIKNIDDFKCVKIDSSIFRRTNTYFEVCEKINKHYKTMYNKIHSYEMGINKGQMLETLNKEKYKETVKAYIKVLRVIENFPWWPSIKQPAGFHSGLLHIFTTYIPRWIDDVKEEDYTYTLQSFRLKMVYFFFLYQINTMPQELRAEYETILASLQIEVKKYFTLYLDFKKPILIDYNIRQLSISDTLAQEKDNMTYHIIENFLNDEYEIRDYRQSQNERLNLNQFFIQSALAADPANIQAHDLSCNKAKDELYALYTYIESAKQKAFEHQEIFENPTLAEAKKTFPDYIKASQDLISTLDHNKLLLVEENILLKVLKLPNFKSAEPQLLTKYKEKLQNEYNKLPYYRVIFYEMQKIIYLFIFKTNDKQISYSKIYDKNGNPIFQQELSQKIAAFMSAFNAIEANIEEIDYCKFLSFDNKKLMEYQLSEKFQQDFLGLKLVEPKFEGKKSDQKQQYTLVFFDRQWMRSSYSDEKIRITYQTTTQYKAQDHQEESKKEESKNDQSHITWQQQIQKPAKKSYDMKMD